LVAAARPVHFPCGNSRDANLCALNDRRRRRKDDADSVGVFSGVVIARIRHGAICNHFDSNLDHLEGEIIA
jgi:hypothetical protein